jgi:UPF0716 protein FxsA
MTFASRILLALLLFGVAEVYLLVKIAHAVGFLGTVGICVLAAVVGSTVLRRQGLRTLRTAQAAIAGGEAPTAELGAGLVLLIAGALLVLPGLLSDVLALVLLIPPVRRGLAAWLTRRIEARLSQQVFPPGGAAGQDGPVRTGRGRIIDIEPDDPR